MPARKTGKKITLTMKTPGDKVKVSKKKNAKGGTTTTYSLREPLTDAQRERRAAEDQLRRIVSEIGRAPRGVDVETLEMAARAKMIDPSSVVKAGEMGKMGKAMARILGTKRARK